MKFLIFNNVKSFLTAFRSKRHNICNRMFSISGINLFALLFYIVTGQIIALYIFILIFLVFIGIFAIILIEFYQNSYRKIIKCIKHFAFKSRDHLNTYIVDSDEPTQFYINFQIGDNISKFYLIIKKTIEYKIEIPELPDYFRRSSIQNDKYIIIKGDMSSCQIFNDTLCLNLTSIKKNSTSKIKVYYLVAKNLENFKKKMKNIIDESIILI